MVKLVQSPDVLDGLAFGRDPAAVPGPPKIPCAPTTEVVCAPRTRDPGDTALAEALRRRDLRLHAGVREPCAREIGEQVSRLEAARQAGVVDQREVEQRFDVRIARGDLRELNVAVRLLLLA